MSELMQNPRPAEHGRFLQKDSVDGKQVDFVNQSTNAAGVFTIGVAGSATNLDFGTVGVSFSYEENGNRFPWESILAWNYANFYIDGLGTGPGFDAQLYKNGINVAGTTAGNRKTMNIDIYGQPLNIPVLTAYDIYSHFNMYFVQNFDTSTHLIGIYSTWKYIVMGGMNG